MVPPEERTIEPLGRKCRQVDAGPAAGTLHQGDLAGGFHDVGDRIAPVGSTKHAESSPSGRLPAFISVGEFGRNALGRPSSW